MMRVIRDWKIFLNKDKNKDKNKDLEKGSIVLIGAFDGLHRGHQFLIKIAKSEAEKKLLPLVLVTFEPSPKNYFLKKAQLETSRVLGFYDKVRLLEKTGVDFLIILKFNQKILELNPESFLEQLSKYLNPKLYCLGADFKFGHNQVGNITTIKNYAHKHGQEVLIVENIKEEIKENKVSSKLSSTALKESLAKGDFRTVQDCLNRPYKLSGKVCFGKQWGRRIGVKTANINLQRCPIPLRGVYAVKIGQIAEKKVDYYGVANIGTRPTLHQNKQLFLEVHILDQVIEIYGKRIEVEFIQKIRDEKKFLDIDSLKQQINQDIEKARVIHHLYK